jgi:hypothetical protein
VTRQNALAAGLGALGGFIACIVLGVALDVLSRPSVKPGEAGTAGVPAKV